MQGITLTQIFFPFELASADAILRIEWLDTLGNVCHVCANWKITTMKFDRMGRKATLQGDPSLTKMVVSLKAMLKTI